MSFGNTADQSILDAANKVFRAIFLDQLDQEGDGELVSLGTMTTRSKAKTVEYDWLMDFAQMDEWVGERDIASFKARNYSVPNVKYQGALSVDRVDVESDELGLYEARFRALPNAHFRKRRSLLADLLLNGDAAGSLGYDGVPFFSQAHPDEDGSGTQSNLADATTPLTKDNFDAAAQQMAELVNQKGEPLDVLPSVIVVGPANYSTARDLFEIATLSGGGENPTFQAVRVVREPYITDNSWYLLDTNQVLRPFILQEADDLELQTLTSIDDEYVIMNDAFFYGLRARYALAYGFWQLAFKADGNTS